MKLIENNKFDLEETIGLSEDIYERGEIKYSEIDRTMTTTSRFNPEKGNEKETIKNKIKIAVIKLSLTITLLIFS